jgi:hypothetical protein
MYISHEEACFTGWSAANAKCIIIIITESLAPLNCLGHPSDTDGGELLEN